MLAFGTSTGEKTMELNAETLSYMVNAILLPAAGVLALKIRRSTPKLLVYASQLATLQRRAKTVVNIVGNIHTIATTVDKSLEDGKLDPDEAEAVIMQIKNLTESPEVKALMEELA